MPYFVQFTMAKRIYDQLLDAAQDQYGYLTPADARALDVDPLRLQDLVRRQLAVRHGHGVYRLVQVRATELDAYMEATLWPSGTRGVLSHETALDLLDLCDVNPSKIHITVPKEHRARRGAPAGYVLHRRDLDRSEVGSVEGIPVVTACRAIVDGLDAHLGPRLLEQAIETARARGLLTRDQQTHLIDGMRR